MFWVVDNFLMRKHRKLLVPSNNTVDPVLYVNGKKRVDTSDDEARLHLMGNESRESLIDDSNGSDYESLNRRVGSK